MRKNDRRKRRQFLSNGADTSHSTKKCRQVHRCDYSNYTLQDEAHNTSSHALTVTSLWKQPVKFMSVGYSQPLQDLIILQKNLDPKIEPPGKPTVSIASTAEEKAQVDCLLPADSKEIKRPVSPAVSETSSIEVILFQGRKAVARQANSYNTSGAIANTSCGSTYALPSTVEKNTVPQQQSFGKSEKNDPLDLNDITKEIQAILDNNLNSINISDNDAAMVKPSHRRALRRESRNRKKQKKRSHSSSGSLSNPISLFSAGIEDDSDAFDSDMIIDDYMDNLAENGFEFEPTIWSQRDLGGEEGDIFINTEEKSTKDPSDGESVDGRASKSNIFQPSSQNTVEIFTKFDSSPAADDLGFEIDEFGIDTTSSETEENNNNINGDDEDEDEDENNDEDKDDNKVNNPRGFDEMSQNDDFFNQDIISVFPNHIIKRKGKGSINSMPFLDPSLDPDIKDILIKSINSNRAKKTARKKQRELLRAQGQLGKITSNDLSVKYPSGMQFEEIASEFWEFLSSDNEQFTLLPMAPSFRKGIHDIAHKLGLVSKSTGKGNSRRPVLYKKGNPVYIRSRFDQIMLLAGKRHFKVKSASMKGAVFSGSSRQTRYQEGEIIGGSLPELGNDNRGHTLLQKMGWSRGTALGAIENKGIMEPVMQKMKNTKAGLG
ncbi:squalene synthetase-like protein [Ceratocystis pirilliformis]|uniref:Squalene synthetase-like protein n=1 Tax=Ceratocystis pirilliformis TaxID=259994 RepID=A0ABR3ZG28_9PEZI